MKFMVLVPANKDSEAGRLPNSEELEAMGNFNEQLVKAGVMLGGEGLHPTSTGARMTWSNGKTSVKDGPFTESKELVAGFWILQVRSKEEVLEWMSRAPFPDGTTIEIRQLFSTEDFAPSDPTGKHRELENKLREEVEKQQRSS